MYTLYEMQAMQNAGKGRIYWYYEDSAYGAVPQPIWVPKNLERRFF